MLILFCNMKAYMNATVLTACNLTYVHTVCSASLPEVIYGTSVHVSTYDSIDTYCSLIMKLFCEKVKVLCSSSRWCLITTIMMKKNQQM